MEVKQCVQVNTSICLDLELLLFDCALLSYEHLAHELALIAVA